MKVKSQFLPKVCPIMAPDVYALKKASGWRLAKIAKANISEAAKPDETPSDPSDCRAESSPEFPPKFALQSVDYLQTADKCLKTAV